MRLFTLIISFLLLLTACRSKKDSMVICGGFQVEQRIELRKLSLLESDDELYTMYGNAYDVKNGEAMPFMKIKFVASDSTITGTLTDINGSFIHRVKPGKYHVEISYVGLESYSLDLDAQPSTIEQFEINVIE